MIDSIVIKQKIKNHIKKTPGINQKTVAGKMGLSNSYLNDILNNRTPGSLDMIMRIAYAAGMPFTRLLAETDLQTEEERTPMDPTQQMLQQILMEIGGINSRMARIERDVDQLKKAKSARQRRRSGYSNAKAGGNKLK